MRTTCTGWETLCLREARAPKLAPTCGILTFWHSQTPPAAALPDDECPDTAKEHEVKLINVLECLLAHGARVHCTDIYGDSPLHYAAVRGYPRLVQKLIEAGASIKLENMYGSSAQRLAEINSVRSPLSVQNPGSLSLCLALPLFLSLSLFLFLFLSFSVSLCLSVSLSLSVSFSL